MRIFGLLLAIACLCAPLARGASSSLRISQFINFEGGANGEVIDDANSDTNIWNGFTFGNTNGGRFEIVDTYGTHNMTISTTGQQPLLRPIVLADGTTKYETNSTRSLKMDDSVSKHEFMRYWFPGGTKNKVSWGFYLTTSGWTSDFKFYDMAGSEGNTGEFVVLNMENQPAGLVFGVHTFAGVGAQITLARGSTYWFCFLWDAAGTLATMKIYDPVTWQLLHTSTLLLDNTPCRFLAIGRYDDHDVAPAGSVHYVDDLVIDDTGANFPIFPASAWLADSTARTAFNTVYTSAADGDSIVFPLGSSNQWTTQFDVNKTLNISGVNAATGSNYNGSVIQLNTGGDQDSVFRFLKTYSVVSNMYLAGVVVGSPGTLYGYLLSFNSNWCVAANCHFTRCFSGTVMYSPGLVYNCSFLNCRRMGRAFGVHAGAAAVANGWVTPYDITIFTSTNYSVWEDNRVAIDGNMIASLNPQDVITAADGGMWIARFNTITNFNFDYSPTWDFHGGLATTEYGCFAVQIYGNTLSCGGTTSQGYWVDARGGASLVYSNLVRVSTAQMRYRIKNGDEAFYVTPGPQITNSYMWRNFDQNGARLMTYEIGETPGTDTEIQLHRNFETNSPTELLGLDYTNYSIAYPHFLRPQVPTSGGGVASGGSKRGVLGRATAIGGAP